MGIRESLLNTITSVSNGDFIRVVTSAGASSKATLANVMKSFETGLGAKSSLSTSDYVRVVGSDDAAYKQSLSSLMDTMGVTRTLISNGVDLNTLLPNANSGTGYYRGNNISTMTNKPSPEVNAFPWALDAIDVSGYVKQILHVYTAAGNIVTYERIQHYSSGDRPFADWEKLPTRTEVDALKNKTNFELRSVSYSYSLAVGGNTNTNLKTLIDADIPSGKTFLGIAGTESGNVGIVISNAYYSNSNYSLQLFNVGTVARTGTTTIYYLCG